MARPCWAIFFHFQGLNGTIDFAMEKAFLKIQDVTKFFGNFAALKGVSLDIAHGEFVCFLGPSGCGKTTLLRAIAGLDIQTSGTVIQEQKDVSNLPPDQRDFGIVFQSYALFPNLTIRRNVAYGLENMGMARADIDERVNELLDMVGLEDQQKKYPAQLSGGQQQRVALSRAIATSPSLLLLDEPLSALDAKVRQSLRHEIKELQRRLGVTTIMVTHDQEEALSMADRIVVMNDGVIDQVGSPEDIYLRPNSPFVADFIGAMNFFDAHVDASAGTIKVGDRDFKVHDNRVDSDGRANVAIRPEDIMAGDSIVGDDNTMDVKITEIEFLGSNYRASMTSEALGGQTLLADISPQRARRDNIQIGMEIRIQLPADFLHVYPISK
jgi:iron(III) transport system ATP-binding protein